MNTASLPQAHLRHSLKVKWLTYYRDNRDWLVKLSIWVSDEGERRPSASFILATACTLEPRLPQLMPIVVDLTSNPDRVIKALGLHFSPDEELERAIASGLISPKKGTDNGASPTQEVKLLPASTTQKMATKHSAPTNTTAQDSVDLYLDQTPKPNEGKKRSSHRIAAQRDAACSGTRSAQFTRKGEIRT